LEYPWGELWEKPFLEYPVVLSLSLSIRKVHGHGIRQLFWPGALLKNGMCRFFMGWNGDDMFRPKRLADQKLGGLWLLTPS
jgi:hypothetical protein